VLAALALLLASCACEPDHAREVARVRAHLEEVERELLAGPPWSLTPDQSARRAEAIRNLRRYIEAERYPTNRSSEAPIPIFVDEDGARCAVAALLEASGHHALVARIARTRNLAYVEELADEPELVAWLADHGVTLREAARIQPTYHAPGPTWRPTVSVIAGVEGGSAAGGGTELAFSPGVRLGIRRSIQDASGGCWSCFAWSGSLVAEYSRHIVAGAGRAHHVALLAEYERKAGGLVFHYYLNGGPVAALDRDAEPGSGFGGQLGAGLTFRRTPYPLFFGLTASALARADGTALHGGANAGIAF
jgi:hypothetical protein